MGTQQLLLIVLGVIVVGVAVLAAIIIFQSNSASSNRDAIIADLENFAANAQVYYRKPTTMAGGGYNYLGFNFVGIDTGNDNGSFSVTSTPPAGPTYVPGSTDPITVSTQTLFIVGCGTEIGDDGANPVKAFIEVSHDSLISVVLN